MENRGLYPVTTGRHEKRKHATSSREVSPSKSFSRNRYNFR